LAGSMVVSGLRLFDAVALLDGKRFPRPFNYHVI